MSSELQIFSFESSNIRTIPAKDDDGGWINAADVCEFAGIKNVPDAVSRLDDDEKRAIVSTDSAGRPNRMTFVNEAGFYNLVLSCRLRKEHPNFGRLKRFRKWVVTDVLPAIRRTGRYEGTEPSAAPTPFPVAPTAELNGIEFVKAMASGFLELAHRHEEHGRQLVAFKAEVVTRCDAIEHKADAALARCGDTGFYTLVGYCNLHKIRLTRQEMAAVGARLRKYCDASALPYRDTPNQEYGTVKLWPVEALEAWRTTLPGQAA